MSTWVDRLTDSPTRQALALTAQFAEQRQQVLAENLANVDTPNHHSRRLDPEPFQTSLRTALDQARPSDERGLELRGNAQFSTGADGRVTAQPATEPAPNVLFHDGTNARVEQLLADTNQNALTYDLATTLLRGQFNTLLSAIRGRTA
jgi:flagellar basal-body rod protein FlgB